MSREGRTASCMNTPWSWMGPWCVLPTDTHTPRGGRTARCLRRVTLDQFCTLILQRTWHAHHKLAVARACPRSPLHNGPATTIYNLWRASVAVHALMRLVSLHAPHHLADTFRTLLEVVGRVQRDRGVADTFRT